MTWLQTFGGRVYDYERPDVRAIDIVDIAHALSQQCRFAGHCGMFYSVAEHSVHVLRRVQQLCGEYPLDTPQLQAIYRTALLHDAHEAYVCDLPAPLKWVVGPEYDRLEHIAKGVVAEAFDLPDDEILAVKQADLELLATEASQIMADPPQDWDLPHPPLELRVRCWAPQQARFRFLDRARQLNLLNETHFSWAAGRCRSGER